VTDASAPGRARDITAFAAILAGLTALVLFLSDGAVLFTRPFWVDEWLAVFVANGPSPSAIVGDLTAGADGGAPLLHLMFWTLRRLGVTLDPVVVRAFSLSTVLLALVVVFAVVRRRLPFDAACAAALAVGAHQLIIWHSYDGRFYGPWLLGASLVALFLGRRQDASDATPPGMGGAGAPAVGAPPGRMPGERVALAAAALLVCGIHPYGILSLGLMLAGGVAAYGARWREGLRNAVPALTGLVAVALVAPIALGQRNAYTVSTWLTDFTPGQLIWLLDVFWSGAVPLLAVGLLGTGAVIRGARGTARPLDMARVPLGDAGMLALFALALMPVALALVSSLGQPSMLPRYAVVTVLAWAPLVATACFVAGRWATRGLCLVLIWFWLGAYVREARAKTAFGQTIAREQLQYEQARRSGLPLIVQSMHVMYPLIGSAPRESSAMFLALSDSAFRALWDGTSHIGQANRGVVLERDLARVHFARWGFPRLVTPGALDTAGSFLLLASEWRRPAGFASMEHFAARVFPQRRIKRLLPDLYLLERADEVSSK
jgi:hypothetical protein